jgi:retron-type reverse transcriptase
MISAAPFRDRIVHTALVNVLEPVFERQFIFHSYACRKAKGTHRALAQFVRWARTSDYILKLDIHKFFPSIDHQILKDRLRRTIKDPKVLWLCDLIIDHSNEQESLKQYFPGDSLFSPLERRRGIPIGNLTSQFFANVYLDDLDHFLKDRLRLPRYLRYVDDLCCHHDEKTLLQELRRQVVEFLANYRLKLNEGKSRIRRVKEGIEFLGFVVYPNELRLNQDAVRRQRRRIKVLQQEYADGIKSGSQIKASLQAWNAHASFGTTWRMREEVFRSAAFCRKLHG